MKASHAWGRRGLLLTLLGVHAGLLAWIAVRWSPTFDEPHHLAAGVRLWQTGRFDLDRGNPPLVRALAALPVMLAQPAVDWQNVPKTVLCGSDFLVANGPRSLWLVTLGRWALIPLSLAGAYVCYRWAREWYGDAAGMTTLLLWCFSPNILANGHLITGDMPATSLGIAAFYLFWRWLAAPSWPRAAWAGVFWGLAELSKFVWLILYPFWPLAWLLWRWLHRREPGRPGWFQEAAQLAAMGLLSVWLINLGYGFDGSLHYFTGASAQQGAAAASPYAPAPRSGIAAVLHALPIPLPKDYVDGFAEVQTRLNKNSDTYLRGEFRSGGYWYYYLYAILVKEPVGMLLLLALAAALAAVSARYRVDGPREALLACFLLAVFGSITLSGVMQRLRYALPVFPLLFIWAGRTGRTWQNRQPALGVLAAGCLAWSVISSLSVYPYSLSYFNELAGGPRHGYRHLNEANIDWGQDLRYLKQWLDAHPEATPLHLAYFGSVDPRLAGIEFSLPPVNRPCPGWHAVSLSILTQPDTHAYDGQGGRQRANASLYDYFWDLKPVAMAGYSIYIYHVTSEDVDRRRAECERRMAKEFSHNQE
jgi:hypothetical protein